MTYIGNEPGCNELVGNDAQSRPDLPAIADAPPLAPLPEGGEGQPGAGAGSDESADGQAPPRQDGEGHASSGQNQDAHEVLYESFKVQRDGGRAPLRQGFGGQGFGGQGFDGQAD